MNTIRSATLLPALALAVCMHHGAEAQSVEERPLTVSLPACELMPRLIVGAPSASLNPLISHKNLVSLSPNHRPTPIGLEIFPHVGFGLDGERLIIESGAPSMTIIGHQTLAPFPQRNFQVVTDGSGTHVMSYFQANSHDLQTTEDGVQVVSPKPHFSHSLHPREDGLTIEGDFPVQGYHLWNAGDALRVKGKTPVRDSVVTCPEPGHIHIEGGVPERTWDVTRIPGGLHFEGPRSIQTFDVLYRPNGFTIQGHYPQQTYDVVVQ